MSELPISQALRESVAVSRTASGGSEHLAVNGIGFLPGFKAFSSTPGLFPGAAQVDEEEHDGEDGQRHPKKPTPRRPGEKPRQDCPDHHRLPFRQSSTRAQIVTAMPASARAMKSQRSVSR